ncbi:mechanosensitive ion channel [Curvibacter sp. HBC61]|uniref:Small-conductance mechanosensitive channel n=1 Tax=Curvibacter cyanobacteriorum TaxID=3026422 RepID=A0ABT5MVW3_9BURK|nr:mechanosensitive ion channel domain-containing protein [Curvibacter sp. HBC61]MDD0837596.1 mechanosensitive ion channel [Curvibacter sp. HBC61]
MGLFLLFRPAHLSQLALCLGLVGMWGLAESAKLPAAQATPPSATQAAAPPATPVQALPPGNTTSAVSAVTTGTAGATLRLNHRTIVTFRAYTATETPADRAALAHEALIEALATGGPVSVTYQAVKEQLRFDVNGQAVLWVLPADLGGGRPTRHLDVAAREVQARLQQAVDEYREARDPRALALASLYSVLASAVSLGLLYLLLVLRRRWTRQWHEALSHTAVHSSLALFMREYLTHTQTAVQWLSRALALALALLVLDTWVTFVLRQFAYTRAWGERSSERLLGLFSQFASAVVDALPNLLIALLIAWLARLAVQLFSAVMERVEQGELSLGAVDAEIAVPTRRIGNLLICLFALAMAYPYLPGSGSEAFKGLTVLAGLMLSLGASGLVGQALSGLSLLYSRSLRVGEYVKLGQTEGTVVGLSLFTTRVHTGMGEEVCLPNSVVFSQPICNYSRLVAHGRFVLHASVTIGYATPWRQVHAMLIEAARRAEGVASSPPPYVVQTGLSDYYVDYLLCGQSNQAAPQRRIEAMSQLYAHIQDVFNEMGVQIMSPHYRGDPPAPQVVPPGPWASTQAEARDFLQPPQAHGPEKAPASPGP